MKSGADAGAEQAPEPTANATRPDSQLVWSDGDGAHAADEIGTDEDHYGLARRRPAVTARQVRRTGAKLQPDLVGKQGIQGQQPGDRYVRVFRMQGEDFEHAAPGHLVATRRGDGRPRGSVGRAFGGSSARSSARR